MTKRIQFELELPDEVAADLNVEDIQASAREALVMALLREHQVSQGKAAEMLGIYRRELFQIMSRYHVPVIDFTAEELKRELESHLRS